MQKVDERKCKALQKRSNPKKVKVNRVQMRDIVGNAFTPRVESP